MNWIITANLKYYDVFNAFKELKRLDWRQTINVSVGDTIYIYIGKPYGKLMYECKVVKDNKETPTINDRKFFLSEDLKQYKKYMELELIKSFNTDKLNLEKLKEQGLITVQWATQISDNLNKYIQKCAKM